MLARTHFSSSKLLVSPFQTNCCLQLTILSKVLDEANKETAKLIINMQLEDLDDSVVNKLASIDTEVSTDERMAGQVYETEHKQCRAVHYYEREETELAEASAVAVADLVAAPAADAINIVLFDCASCRERIGKEHCYQTPCQHY